jgi:hypothetical protein
MESEILSYSLTYDLYRHVFSEYLSDPTDAQVIAGHFHAEAISIQNDYGLCHCGGVGAEPFLSKLCAFHTPKRVWGEALARQCCCPCVRIAEARSNVQVRVVADGLLPTRLASWGL